MRILTFILLSILIISCGEHKHPTETHPPAGLKLIDLPSSAFSRPLQNDESNFVEIVISGDKSELFHQGKFIATSPSEDTLISEIRRIRKSDIKLGQETSFLISASASTPFEPIRERIRTAAKTGIYQIHFLVRSNPPSDPKIGSIELPKMGGALSEIEPYFLHITSEGHVFSGTGLGRSRLDTDAQDQNLKNVSGQFELFSAAAKAAGVPNPTCQLHVDSHATYQRAIDVISLANKHDLKPFLTDMLPEPDIKPIDTQIRKPTPPSYSVRPLGLAPRKEK